MTDYDMTIRADSKNSFLRKGTVIGVAGALAVSAVLILAAGGFRRPAPPSAPSATGMRVGDHDIALDQGAPQWSSLRFAKAEPTTEHWTHAIPARVHIDETRAARVGSPLAGRVTKVMVEFGQKVDKDTPLFSVASTDLVSLRNEAAKASVDLDVAKAQYARVHDMVQAELLPGKDEVAAAADKRQAEIELTTAQSKINSLKVSTQKDNEFTVRAPRAGIVVEKTVLPDQEVTTEGALIEIADLSRVWVVADLFENEATGIKEGTTARITVPSVPGFSVEVTVETVSAILDPVRNAIPVRVLLDNSDGRLKPNAYADMRLKIDSDKNGVEIAASSLVSDGAKQYVYVQQEPGHLVKRDVVAGPVRDGKVTILDGLALGETVVVEGGILLDNQINLSH